MQTIQLVAFWFFAPGFVGWLLSELSAAIRRYI